MKKVIIAACVAVSLAAFAGLWGGGAGKLVPLMHVV
jgi:hypothetical protein